MDVRSLKESEHSDWDDFLEKSPQYSLYSHTWYLSAWKVKFKILACYDGQGIVGGMVIAEDELRFHSNPLLCKYLGICYYDFQGKKYQIESKKRRVAERLISEIKDIGTFDYNFHPSVIDWLPFYWQGFSQTTKYTYIINLEGKELQEIKNQFNNRLRSKINKAEKENKYSIIYEVPYKDFFKVNEKTFRRQGGRMPYNYNRLKNLVKTLEEKQAVELMGVIDEGGRLMSVLGQFMDRQSAYLVLNGFDPNTIRSGANEFLICNAIQSAKERGLNRYDFEGSMISGIESFYRNFGGDLVPFLNIQKPSILISMRKQGIKLYKKMMYGK